MGLAILLAFVAGLITAVSPCVLPVLPIVLAGGVAGGENRRRPFLIIAGLAVSFFVSALFATWILDKLGLPKDLLRNIAIDPSLPARQAEAFARLPSQPLMQVYLAPKAKFWERDGYAPSLFTDSGAGMIAAARNRSNPTEVTSIACWITGDAAAALDRLPADAIGRAVIAEIERIRPAAAGALEFVALHSWGADPYAGGAWAYFRPGDVSRYAANLGAAHGRLHFCGEHLAVESRGMEGAMESGERAAAEIFAQA